MADGVPITPGAGATIATDDAGAAGQVQIIKLAVSANGEATPIGADANGLDVDPTRLPGTVADGGALPSVVFIMGGYDGSAAQVLATDASGVQQVDVLEFPELPSGTKSIGKVVVTSLEGEPKIKVSVLEGEPKVKVATIEGEPKVKVAALEGNLPTGANSIGNVGLITRNSGGCSIFRSIDLDETEEQIKASAGQIYGYAWSNKATAARFLKFYNATEANVTVGSTTPVMTIELPKESAGHVSWPVPIAFGTAITAAATTGVADADTGAPGTNDVILNCFYG